MTGVLVAVLLFLLPIPACADVDGATMPALSRSLPELEFRDEPLRNVFLAIGDVAGVSVVTDTTVRGRVSQVLSGMTVRQAVEVLSSRHRVLWWTKNGVVHVSRVQVSRGEGEATLTIRALDAPLDEVVRRVAAVSETPVLHDPLPSERVTLRADAATAFALSRLLVRRHPRYSVERTGEHVYIRDTTRAESAPQSRVLEVARDDGSFTAEVHGVPLSLVLERLFEAGSREFVLLAPGETRLEHLRFAGHGFDELLTRILSAADASFDVRDGTYYIYAVDRRHVLDGLRRSERLELRHATVSQLESLLPSKLSRGGSIRFDEQGNAVVVTGRRDLVAAVRSFLAEVDRPPADHAFRRFDLAHTEVPKVLSRLPARFAGLSPVEVPGTNAFVARLGEARAGELRQFLRLVDRGPGESVVRLRYIRAEELLRHLPPEVEADAVHTTPDPRVVIVSGPEEMRRAFAAALEVIDKPVPQIKYQLLVVQYEKGRAVEWTPEVESRPVEAGDSSVLLGRMGDLLSLNFDVVTSLGYRFALELSHRISNDEARVLADTTLNGLSGEQVEFQNTNTFRYRDEELADDGGAALGVTREITSGLFVGIEGWSSGDDMITMDIAATLSRRGRDVSADGTNPPPTSERVVNTQVRTRSGRPVVIGGLVQQDASASERKTPVLGSIPLLGRLFRSTSRSVEETELALYVLPIVERRRSVAEVSERLEGYFERLVGEPR